MCVMEAEDNFSRHTSNVVQASTQFERRFFHASNLMFEKKCLPFSGRAIDSRVLHRRKCNCESHAVTPLKLTQVVNVK